MKITMLGSTGVGKTAYMLAMYYVLGRKGLKDFKLVAERDLDVRLGRQWADLSTRGIWPRPTEQSDFNIMKFRLEYKEKFITNFDFIDYRGGAINETSDSTDAKALYQHMFESDSVMILADAWYIVNADEIIADERNQINNIQNLVDDFLRKYPRKPLSISIVLTKFDTVHPDEFLKLQERAYALFERLIKRIKSRSDYLRGTFIPVAVTGFGRTRITVNEPEGVFGLPEVNTEFTKRPDPKYVHWPVLYSIAKEFELTARMAQKSAIETMDAATRADAKISFWDDVGSLFSNRASQRDMRNYYREASQREWVNFLNNYDKLQLLIDEVAVLPEIAAHNQIYRPF